MPVKKYDGTNWVTVAGDGAQGPTGPAGASATTVVTTKGDLLGYSTTAARLAVGTNNQVLTADSAEATGLKWATPASGLTFISRSTFSNVASINIDNFDNTYESYLMIIENIHAATTTDDILMCGRYGTTTYTAADYYAANPAATYASSSWSWYNSSSATAFTLMHQTNSSYPAQAAIRFADVGDASRYFSAYGQWATRDGMWTGLFGGEIFSQQTWSGIQLKSSSSNITGAVSMYGLAKA